MHVHVHVCVHAGNTEAHDVVRKHMIECTSKHAHTDAMQTCACSPHNLRIRCRLTSAGSHRYHLPRLAACNTSQSRRGKREGGEKRVSSSSHVECVCAPCGRAPDDSASLGAAPSADSSANEAPQLPSAHAGLLPALARPPRAWPLPPPPPPLLTQPLTPRRAAAAAATAGAAAAAGGATDRQAAY